MAAVSNIGWTDSTFNGWIGCTRVSPGCDHCYAEAMMDTWLHRVRWGPGQARQRTSDANWEQPPRWEREHADFEAEHGRRRRVFCSSLSDVFDHEVPIEWRIDLFRLFAATPHLTWIVLTKRVGNVRRMIREARHAVGRDKDPDLWRWLKAWDMGDPPQNLWLGATVVDQAEADRDGPKLLATPAAVRFLSVEPMLVDIRLGSFLQRSPSAAFQAGRVTPDMPAWTRIGSTRVDWIICGGESGPNARPMDPAWPRALRDQCAAAGVAFFFKQAGGRGADKGGHLLDGVAIQQWPEVAR